MTHRVIGMIAAMPEEIKPFLRRAGAYSREKIDGFDAWRFSLDRCEILLVRSGMGSENASAATRALIAATTQELIINFGFAGGVTGETGVGDIVVAERILLCKEGLFSEQPGIAAEKTDELVGLLDRNFQGKRLQIRRGTFITAGRIMSKLEMARILPQGTANPVLEMETAAVARAAYEENVPLVAIRAVSDGAEEELGFTIGEFADRELNIRPGKVFLAMVKKPWIVPQLLRLARNSRIAGKNLAAALAALLKAL